VYVTLVFDEWILRRCHQSGYQQDCKQCDDLFHDVLILGLRINFGKHKIAAPLFKGHKKTPVGLTGVLNKRYVADLRPTAANGHP